MLNPEKYALQQHVHCHVVVFDRGLIQWAGGAPEAGVVVENVEPAPPLDRQRDGVCDIGLPRHIAPHRRDVSTQFRGQARTYFVLEVRDHNFRPFAHEQTHRRRPYPARAARHHRYLAI